MQITVSHVQSIGTSLKLWAQCNAGDLKNVQLAIDSVSELLNGSAAPTPGSIPLGDCVLVQLANDAAGGCKYYRSRVTALHDTDFVGLTLIDYGNNCQVRPAQIRTLTPLPNTLTKFLREVPPQASDFILSGLCANWDNRQLEIVQQELCNKNFDTIVDDKFGNISIVRIANNGVDYTTHLSSQKGVGQSVPVTLQKRQLLHFFKAPLKLKTTTPQTMFSQMNREFSGNPRCIVPPEGDSPNGRNSGNKRPIVKSTRTSPNARLQVASGSTSQQAVPTYTSASLNIGYDYEVYCCYIEDGPNCFSIQLKDSEADLNTMMARLENIALENLREAPPVGMACIARYSEDKQLYRAVIMSIKSNACQVLYVDYGNTEMVEFHNIYKVPPEFLDIKTFSLRFTLSGCKQLQPIDEDTKRYFKDLILNKELVIKVMPLEGSPFVQYGELYLDGYNIMDSLRKYAGQNLSYGGRIELEMDKIYKVIVKYVDTPQKFYIQQIETLAAFDEMMMRLKKHCKTANNVKDFIAGAACAAIYEDEDDWCRTEIIEVDGKSNALVRYVDYGGTRNVKQSALKQLTPAFIAMPPQVIECCLIGFENLTNFNKSWRSQLEMLAEDKQGCPKELSLQALGQFSIDSYIVNLLDFSTNPPMNLPTRMYKFCMPMKMFMTFEASMMAKGLCGKPSGRVGGTSADTNATAITEASSGSDKITNKRRDTQAIYSVGQKERSPRGDGGKKSNSDFKREKSSGNMRNKIPRFNKTSSPMKGGNNPSEWADLANIQNNELVTKRSQTSSASSNRSSVSPGSSRQPTPTAEEMMPYSRQFVQNSLVYNHQYGVHLSWWISPHEFYVQLQDNDATLKDMMRQMQSFYANRPATETKHIPPIGSSCVVYCLKDKVFYRARVQDYNDKVQKFKVHYVDFGNTAIVTLPDIWPVERRFIDHPQMSVQCSLDQIVANYDRADMQLRVDKYLSKKKFSCLFLETRNSITTAVLKVEQDNLRECLINDGIVSAIPSGVDLSRLAGQTILIKVAFIKSLACFRVQIFGCDITLICAYKDLKLAKSNTQLSNEFQQQYEGKSFAASVESVSKDNVLILSPMIPLLTHDLAPLFCDFPILSNNFSVNVVHVESANTMFVHHSGHAQHLQHLLENMFSHYESKGIPLTKFSTSTSCAAKSLDGNWYRGIISSADGNKITVQYVDYGNQEVIEAASVKVLDDLFLPVSAFAIKVYLPQTSIKSNEAVIDEITTMTTNYQLSFNVLDFYKGRWIVDICSNGNSLTTELVKKQLVSSVEIAIVRQQIDNELSQKAAIVSSVQPPTLPGSVGASVQSCNKRLTAIISHVDSPERFYLQLESDVPQFDMLNENIQIVAPSLPQLEDLSVNTLCIAKFSASETWYRAKIIDSDTEITTVQFIDIGNTDSITDHTLIKEMNEAFRGDKAYCIPCSLSVNSSENGDWSDVANNLLHMAAKDTVHFEYISQSNNKNYVNLYVGGRNLVDVLIEMGLGVAGKPIRSPEKCFVSHINSLSDFYIQFDKDSAALETFDDFLACEQNFTELTEFSEGTICTAKFEDGQWYRAKITRRQEEGAQVFFVDYGNTMVASELRALPAEIAELPHLARNCALRMPESVKKWNKEAEEEFVKLAATGATIFNVDIIMSEKNAIVDLYLQGQNIIELLPQESSFIEASTDPRSEAASSTVVDEKDFNEESSKVSDNLFQNSVDTIKGIPQESSFIESLNPEPEPLLDEKILKGSTTHVICPEKDNIKSLPLKKRLEELLITSEFQTKNMEPPAPADDSSVSAYNKVFITHVTSPNEFYVQYDKDTDALQTIVQSLIVAETFPELEKKVVGASCVAEFIEDGAYYRAKILSVCNEGCDVLFIDYGNSALSNKLRIMPDSLSGIEAIAKCCSLHNPRGVWNEKSTLRFVEVTQTTLNDTFQIELTDSATDPCKVKLYVDGKCVNDELIELLGDLIIPEETAKILSIVDETIQSTKKSISDGDVNEIDAIAEQLIEMNWQSGDQHNTTPISHQSSSGRGSKESDESVSSVDSLPHGRMQIDLSTLLDDNSKSVLDMTTITENMFEAASRKISYNKKHGSDGELAAQAESNGCPVDNFINGVDEMVRKSQSAVQADVMKAFEENPAMQLLNSNITDASVAADNGDGVQKLEVLEN